MWKYRSLHQLVALNHRNIWPDCFLFSSVLFIFILHLYSIIQSKPWREQHSFSPREMWMWARHNSKDFLYTVKISIKHRIIKILRHFLWESCNQDLISSPSGTCPKALIFDLILWERNTSRKVILIPLMLVGGWLYCVDVSVEDANDNAWSDGGMETKPRLGLLFIHMGLHCLNVKWKRFLWDMTNFRHATLKSGLFHLCLIFECPLSPQFFSAAKTWDTIEKCG